MIREFIKEVFYSDEWKGYVKTIPDNVTDEKPHAQKQMRIILNSLNDENVNELYKDCMDKFPSRTIPENYYTSLKYKEGFSETELLLIAHLLWLRSADASEGSYLNTLVGMIDRDNRCGWCILEIESLYKKYKEELVPVV